MKPLSKIAMLAAICTCIVAFWLVPHTNEAADKDYVRIYEDTDAQPVSFVVQDTSKVKKKKYKQEKIKHNEKLSKVNGKMFSRVMQFEEVPADSTTVQIVEEDKVEKPVQSETKMAKKN
ncbi:hypothetical protein [Pseudochryseolinea flava]|uniref:Uncharacterized protein n=1 Tax=Pseudochryseolinea flava TaxID=2059302 RepID=A0A364Y4Y1_9BACT|nr:hypothetical protein [Pseudochryseolinea flava]RAW00887.1 hypothetical protein DQQ10_11635 [Pseudochryseolinea flava]